MVFSLENRVNLAGAEGRDTSPLGQSWARTKRPQDASARAESRGEASRPSAPAVDSLCRLDEGGGRWRAFGACFGRRACVWMTVAITALMLVACFVGVPPALGLASTEDRIVEPVAVQQVSAGAFGVESSTAVEDGTGQLAVARFCPLALSAVCDPASIEAGIDCGMDWMCGIEPCLCGSADAWGGCSCNGLETLAPTLAYASSNEGVVRVVEAAGRTWLVPVSAGTATVTCTASLKYHADAAAQLTVTVGGPTLADAALLGACLLALALMAAVVLAVRHAMRRRGRQHADKS